MLVRNVGISESKLLPTMAEIAIMKLLTMATDVSRRLWPMATIKEVAQRAGVSIRTVSRVLNDHPHVANATRERVLRVIEELDFRPSAAARYMRTGQSQLIGFLTDEIAQNIFSYDLIIGAQQAAWEHEKLLFLLNTGNDPHVETRAINMMRDHQVEGIVYASLVSPRGSLLDGPLAQPVISPDQY